MAKNTSVTREQFTRLTEELASHHRFHFDANKQRHVCSLQCSKTAQIWHTASGATEQEAFAKALATADDNRDKHPSLDKQDLVARLAKLEAENASLKGETVPEAGNITTTKLVTEKSDNPPVTEKKKRTRKKREPSVAVTGKWPNQTQPSPPAVDPGTAAPPPE